MKKVILHIGLPKTGSTSLQHWLYDHIKFYQEKKVGYYYPSMSYFPWGSGSNGTFIIANCLYDLGAPVNQEKKDLLLNNPFLDIARLRINKEMIENFPKEKEKFRNFVKDYDTIILSEEMFSHYEIYYDNFWDKVKEYLDDTIEEEYEVDVVIYLRRQDEWIQTKWKEDMRNELASPYDFTETIELYEKIGYLDYYSTLNRIARVFGHDHVNVRTYDSNYFLGHSLSNDFILSNPSLLFTELLNDLPQKANKSISGETAYSLALINKGIIPITKRLKYVYKAANDFDYHNYYSKKKESLLDKQETELMIEKYKESNERIEKEFLNGRQLFDYTIKDVEVVKPDKDRDYDNALKIKDLIEKFIRQDENGN